MELEEKNYHSIEARKEYMGYSQFKKFLECEKEALAYVNGETEEKSTEALLFGSYVDAYFSNQLDDFVVGHPEMFNSKTGELKTPFKNVETVIEKIESDEKFLKYLQGEHQVIMVGEISGVKFKIKIDSLHRGKVIVDQKVMKSLDPVWITDNYGRNIRVNFVNAYRYDLEAAIYQEIYRQNTGEKLPFVLAVTTKEEYPLNGLYKIDQEDIDKALQEVIELAPRFDAIKRGEIQPNGCGKCGVCRKNQKVTGIFSFHELDPYINEED